MAERMGFEPMKELPLYTLSKRAPSTTRPPLQNYLTLIISISFFMLFPLVEKEGFFITEEIDFPEKRDDMRIGQKRPDLKTILMEILNKNDFNSEYITKVEKDYVLSNIDKISFFKGNTNEVVIIKKKMNILGRDGRAV